MTHTPLPKHILPKHTPLNAPSSPESEPLKKNDSIEVQEVVEHELTDTQVQPHVQVRQEVPTIPPDLKKIGVLAKGSPQFATYNIKKFPLDQSKLPQALAAPPSESIRWLAALTQYLMEHVLVRRTKPKTTFIQDVIRLFGRDLGR